MSDADRRGLVARRGHLPDLSALVPGHDGDGSGDLAGITRRLPHVAALGVDAIWLSPFFKSPMADMGYDVSDYCAVDPMFGSIDDFDRLVAEAHRLGLKVIIDQVLSHTSDQHRWFRQSRASRDNAKADWYVWADAKPDGTAPNNWLSVFGGPAWEWDGSAQAILHAQFPGLAARPQLPQSATCRTRCWRPCASGWSAASTASASTRSTTISTTGSCATIRRCRAAGRHCIPDANPYGYQQHLHDKTQPENLAFLKRFRALLDEYGGRAGGRRGRRRRPLAGDRRRLYVGRRQAADVLHVRPARPAILRRPCHGNASSAFEAAVADGWICWAFSNHDVMRHVSRWTQPGGDPDAVAKFAIELLAALRGSICLYQGEELGLAGSRTRLRGPARSLRHPLLAGLQGPRRLPHADGLGERQAECRLHQRQAVAAGARGASPSRRRRAGARCTRRCLRTTGGRWRFAERIRRWSPAHRIPRGRRTMCWPLCAAARARSSCASSISPARRRSGRFRQGWVRWRLLKVEVHVSTPRRLLSGPPAALPASPASDSPDNRRLRPFWSCQLSR